MNSLDCESFATTFDTFLETAWTDHGDRPHAVADRLCASLHRVEDPGHVPQFARLASPVFGEHLGQWQRGIDRSLGSTGLQQAARQAVLGALLFPPSTGQLPIAGDGAVFAASRQEALRLFGELPQQERQWCAAEIADLDA